MCSTREFYESKLENLTDAYGLSIQIVGVLSQCDDWYEGEASQLFEELMQAHFENPAALPELIRATLEGALVQVSEEGQALIVDTVVEAYKMLDQIDALQAERALHMKCCPTCLIYCCTQQ
jgi:hypothetical protein